MKPLDLISEAQYQHKAEQWLTEHGWSWYHDRTGEQSEKVTCANCGHRQRAMRHQSPSGLPDIVAVHPDFHVLLLAELKRKGGKLDKAQRAWQQALDDAERIVTGVYYPADVWTLERVIRTGRL